MYEYIKGTLISKTPSQAVIDAGGIGYLLEIPASTCDRLPSPGSDVQILTHLYIREDLQKLYGFGTDSERETFRQLINVSKIGPKVALNILSSISVQDLSYAVDMQDPSRLKSIHGVGAKTAQRLVMELKGKISSLPGKHAVSAVINTGNASSDQKKISVHSEARDALISLGYSESQVENALIRVGQVLGPDEKVEEWIRKALQVV